RELANLESSGLIAGTRKGNLQYYTVNTTHYLYPDLQKIVLKTRGIAGIIRTTLAAEEIDCAFIYGSYAKGTAQEKSDIDVFIVGGVAEENLIPLIYACEKDTGREINYNLMTREEFTRRKKTRDPFVKNVMNEEKIYLTGTCDD
ncbi:MAG: hypothetical protein GYA23_13745, partial [Methanomicrobiales archaeon]|nr:hypothetical protein [Methanomicrobiales archaeon]